MNADSERGRYNFVRNRDGEAAAEEYARRMIKTYLAAVKGNRRKRGKHCAYRQEYLAAAYSFRAILRAV